MERPRELHAVSLIPIPFPLTLSPPTPLSSLSLSPLPTGDPVPAARQRAGLPPHHGARRNGERQVWRARGRPAPAGSLHDGRPDGDPGPAPPAPGRDVAGGHGHPGRLLLRRLPGRRLRQPGLRPLLPGGDPRSGAGRPQHRVPPGPAPGGRGGRGRPARHSLAVCVDAKPVCPARLAGHRDGGHRAGGGRPGRAGHAAGDVPGVAVLHVHDRPGRGV
jgi:hypothetical protein